MGGDTIRLGGTFPARSNSGTWRAALALDRERKESSDRAGTAGSASTRSVQRCPRLRGIAPAPRYPPLAAEPHGGRTRQPRTARGAVQCVTKPPPIRNFLPGDGLHEASSAQIGHSQAGNWWVYSGSSSGTTADFFRRTRTAPARFTSYTFSVIGTVISPGQSSGTQPFRCEPAVTR